jgi:hypothetical protein
MWQFVITLFSWHHDTVCQILHPERTCWFENFFISSTVPVCYIGINLKVLLGAVEQRNLELDKTCYMYKFIYPSLKDFSILFDRIENLRINDSVKMNVEGYYFPFAIHAKDTCTCRVSAVGVKLITFQCFEKSEYVFWCFISIISAIS